MRLSEMELDNLYHFLVAERQGRHESTVEVHGEHASGLEKAAHAAFSRTMMDLNVHASACVQGLFPRGHTYANSAYVYQPIGSDKQQIVSSARYGLYQVLCTPLRIVKTTAPTLRARLLLEHVISYPQ